MKRLFAASLLLLSSTAFAATPNMTGDWNIHNTINGNENDGKCSLVQADNVISGTCKSMEGTDLKVTGKVDGSKVTWQFDSEYNGTAITLTYSATLDDSGKVAGTVDIAPFNVSGDFTATPVATSDKDAK